MKVSLKWASQYLDFALPPLPELVERIGSQLGAVEAVEDLDERYQGIIIAKVISCQDHPNADRLHVCLIDDGGKTEGVERNSDGYVQVVCGAPNVRPDLLVAWLPPGSTVPESVGKEPFVLEARELRGVVSNGMLASPRELALGDNHEGILELDSGQPGDDFATAYQLDDQTIDIENKMFTHRPDCFGLLGVSRELSGILAHQFTSPTWYLHPEAPKPVTGIDITVRNELPSLVPRFMVVPLKDVTVTPSPLWLQTYLLRSGVRPINNVVDITNYMMLLTGQPLHAYDYDKLRKLEAAETVSFYIRNPRDQETLELIGGKTITPRAEAITIATEHHLIGLGGVMGGATTEVSEQTQTIVLECASMDMYSVRRSSMTHGLFTDAVTRFNKGQSPLQNDAVLYQAISMLQELAGAQIAGPVVDDAHIDTERRWVHPPVPITTAFINARLGLDISAEAVQRLLQNVEFAVAIDGDTLTVTAPFWRTDVETREDVVEEVGRLHGFDKLPLVLPKRSITPVTKDPLLQLKSRIRATLAKAGANEILTYSFVHGDLLQKSTQDPQAAFRVSNALSPDLQYFRLGLLPSLLEHIHPNIKAGYSEFALFEMGKGHSLQFADTDNGLPAEFELLDLVYSASDKVARPGAAYYQARKFLAVLLAGFGLELELRPLSEDTDQELAKPFERSRAGQVFVQGRDVPLGIVGEFKASVRKALKLPTATAGFDLVLTELLAAIGAQPGTTRYESLPRYPKLTQDITLKVPVDLAYRAVYEFLVAEIDTNRPPHVALSLTPLDIYQRPGDTDHKQISFRLSIASYDKTLRDSEVSVFLDQLAAAASTTFGAERI